MAAETVMPPQSAGSEDIHSRGEPDAILHGSEYQSEPDSPAMSIDGSADDTTVVEGTPAKRDPKDPNRPRRKKARRACYACQKAHLTCGDERPCERCIKRGRAAECQDGVRKKAKYLNDVPQEDLGNGIGGSLKDPPPKRRRTNSNTKPAVQPHFSRPESDAAFETLQQSAVPQHGPQVDSGMSAPFPPAGRGSFSQDSRGIAAMPAPSVPQQDPGQQNQQQYNNMTFDPTDPSFFNFDISGLDDFGSRFGAAEFGMLGQMSANAYDGSDDSNLVNPMAANGGGNFDLSQGYAPVASSYGFDASGNSYSNWPNNNSSNSRHNSTSQMFGAQGNEMYPGFFPIGEAGGPGSISTASPGNTGLDMSAYTSSPVTTSNNYPHRHSQSEFHNPPNAHSAVNPFAASSMPRNLEVERRRRRDPSSIYQSVTEPYSYTTGFHLLTAFLARRFPKDKVLRIAKALASIRPSFISCTRELSRDDLVFMEKGFQRNLLLYEDYLNAYGCPTIIFRRTGEIALVSKEFSMLTGWKRDVLLGREPNLNVNHGGSSGEPGTGSTSRGVATPSKAATGVEITDGKPQPVFVAELLDDDTAVQFYDDFAKMAFGDSRGHVVRRGKVLKYKTKDDPGWGEGPQDVKVKHEGKNGDLRRGLDVLGEKDGKVDVMISHGVKIDTFDIPMMVVMNLLPIIP